MPMLIKTVLEQMVQLCFAQRTIKSCNKDFLGQILQSPWSGSQALGNFDERNKNQTTQNRLLGKGPYVARWKVQGLQWVP